MKKRLLIIFMLSCMLGLLIGFTVFGSEQTVEKQEEKIALENFPVVKISKPKDKPKFEPTFKEWEPIIEEDYIEEIEQFEEEPVYEEEIIEEVYEEPSMYYYGLCEITAYEWTGNPCANGYYPTEGYTVACNNLPLGTEIYIDGVGYRTVEDIGATWHATNWIDLYLGDVDACYQWGVQYLDVYIVEGNR